jgi:hypothetical protein
MPWLCTASSARAAQAGTLAAISICLQVDNAQGGKAQLAQVQQKYGNNLPNKLLH